MVVIVGEDQGFVEPAFVERHGHSPRVSASGSQPTLSDPVPHPLLMKMLKKKKLVTGTSPASLRWFHWIASPSRPEMHGVVRVVL